MADKKSQFEEVSQAAGAVTVTHEQPAQADTTSNPIPNDAQPNQPPVRTNRPDQPIAQVLGSGAGAHEPVEDEHIGPDGRYYANPDDAPDRIDVVPAEAGKK